MKTIDVYRMHYKEFCEFMEGHDVSKYGWAASEIFNLITHDDGIDELFVKKIIDVCKVIADRTSFEYILDKTNYLSYILVCQLLDRKHWIGWGTSIRGAWFDTGLDNNPAPIIDMNLSVEKHGCDKIPFTFDNIKALIIFMEEDDVNNSK